MGRNTPVGTEHDTGENGHTTEGKKGGGLLFFFGFALLASGVAIATAHEFSWQLVKVGRTLAAYGVESGLLIVSGLLFFGMGFVARASSGQGGTRQTETPGDSQSDLDLVVEQLATDVAQVRTAVFQVSEELTVLSESHQSYVRNQEAQEVESPEEHDALFRLAAGFDTLHAHLDEKVHSLAVQLQERIESVTTAIGETQSRIDQHFAGVGTPTESVGHMGGGEVFSTGHGGEHHEPVHDVHVGDHQVPQEQGFESHGSEDSGGDELEILVDLEDDGDSIEFFKTVDEIQHLVDDGSAPGQYGEVPVIEFNEDDAPPPVLPSQSAADALDALLPDDSLEKHLDRDEEFGL